MFEESHDLLDAIGSLERPALSNLELKALELEDRPSAAARVESAEEIAKILEL